MDSSDVLGIVSLIIAIIAFFIAIAQALQQYISTADGYRKCAESVMGPWSAHRRRVFRLNELRFAVHYQTPVFFVARPDNDRGPISHQKVLNVDGSSNSRVWTNTLDDSPQAVAKRVEAEQSTSRFTSRVHTANDERATWVTLLSMLQKSESEARAWDRSGAMTPKGKHHEPSEYSICVQLQGRPRNWDFMPDGVVRPYAGTTIGHIAEIAVMLGMSWRAFDPDSGNLRAEGNGFALSSSTVQGLGTVVSFLVFGKSDFGAQRIIPTIQIKQLLFGSVPIIFANQTLLFGDDKGIRRTMMKFLKCKQDTFKKYAAIPKHLRSVNFEVIAMLGQCFRLRGSNFKVVPNPTKDPWVDTFSCCALMREFQRQVAKLRAGPHPSPKTYTITEAWQTTLEPVWRDAEAEIDIDMREAVHDVLDRCTRFLVDECGQHVVASVVTAHVAVVVEELYQPESMLGLIESDNEADGMEHYFDAIRPKVVELSVGYETPGASPTVRTAMVSREDVWLMLQFRMCCWWVLHEFDQAESSVALDPRWKESRLPVQIL